MKVDNSFGPIDIAISGLRAQGKQMEVISSNVANARTTDAGKGEPYRRLEATFKSEDGLGGVTLDRIVPDRSDFLSVLDPGVSRLATLLAIAFWRRLWAFMPASIRSTILFVFDIRSLSICTQTLSAQDEIASIVPNVNSPAFSASSPRYV